MRPARSRPSFVAWSRPVAEFVVTLMLAILLFWTFGAKPYAVPTGSMAPALVGRHRLVRCPECGFAFALGVEENGRMPEPECPNCGQAAGFDLSACPVASGDRLLVSTLCFDWRPPQRWELVVFRNPQDPLTAYVKRIVGLPGERVQLRAGDVYINGGIARKSLGRLRLMGVLVFDQDWQPAGPSWRPRWEPLDGARSGWSRQGRGFVHSGRPLPEGVDWLVYRHRVRSTAGLDAALHEYWLSHDGELPVLDRCAYNGADRRPLANRVGDFLLACDMRVLAGDGAVELEIADGRNRFRVHLAVGRAYATLSDETQTRLQAFQEVLSRHRAAHVELALFDQRVALAVDGRLIFGQYFDYARPTSEEPRGTSRPVAIGSQGVAVEVKNLRLYRDIYYTDMPSGDREPHAVGRPITLGDDEYFVLGDNSPISNDSRYWPRPPLLREELLLGRPFLLHLPAKATAVELFGWTFTLSLPDIGRIGLIR